MVVIRRSLSRRRVASKPLHVIAASATISNPAAHLEALTGLRFETVGEELDWSPRHPRQLIHVASKRNDEAMIAAALQKRLLNKRVRIRRIYYLHGLASGRRAASPANRSR